MRALGRFHAPIADGDRRRAFVAAAFALLVAALALTLSADPPARPAADTVKSPLIAERANKRVPETGAPAQVLSTARRFIGGYLALLRGERSARGLADVSVSLRRRLTARPIRVSPGMRAGRARVVRVDGHRIGAGWLVEADIAAGGVRFPVGVVVAADRVGVPVVTRLVED